MGRRPVTAPDEALRRRRVDSAAVSQRAIHLRPSLILVVAVGGALGTAAREAIALAVPDVAGLPVAIFGINVIGAFVLGLLLEALAQRGADVGGRRVLRLFAGTGFCGGFTTYSSLATATAVLLTAGDLGRAVLYGVATVVVGGLATWLGILAGGLRSGR